MQPKVSVVIVFYNGANFIREAIASVQAQGFAGWELVLADDGSSDASPAIAREAAAADPARVRYVAHADGRNHGLAAGRVLGSDAAAGEYLLFLDHDDLLYPDALARMVPLLDARPRANAVFAGTHYWAFDPAVREPDGYLEYAFGPGPVAARRVLRDLIRSDHNHPPPCSTLFRRRAYLAARALTAPWDGMYEDTAMLLKLLTLGGEVVVLGEPVSHYRMHGASMTGEAAAGGTHAEGGYSADRERFLRWAAAEVPLDSGSRWLARAVLLGYRLRRAFGR